MSTTPCRYGSGMGTSGGQDAGRGRAGRAGAAGYVVRDMRLSDAAEVGLVHVEVWRQAYALLMPAEILAALDPQAAVDRWRKTLAQPPDEVRRLVGVAPSGAVVAVATSGPSRDEDAPTPWELWAINILDAHHGSGLADLLMEQLVGVGRRCSGWSAATSGLWLSTVGTASGPTVRRSGTSGAARPRTVWCGRDELVAVARLMTDLAVL